MSERDPEERRPAAIDLDALRRDIVFTERLRERAFTFHTTWGLFSPRGVDEGTQLLIRHLEVNEADRCLDLGCGYGAIGVVMAALAPRGHVTLVDKDFVAVEYARANLERNGLANAEVLLSNGLDQVPRERRFDLAATNVPAKVGNELTMLMFADAHERLDSGGRLYVVSLSGMRKFIHRVLVDIFGNAEKVKQGRVHTVTRAMKAA